MTKQHPPSSTTQAKQHRMANALVQNIHYCIHCGDWMKKDARTIQKHLNTVHKDKGKGKFLCPICQKSFTRKWSTIRHIKSVHESTPDFTRISLPSLVPHRHGLKTLHQPYRWPNDYNPRQISICVLYGNNSPYPSMLQTSSLHPPRTVHLPRRISPSQNWWKLPSPNQSIIHQKNPMRLTMIERLSPQNLPIAAAWPLMTTDLTITIGLDIDPTTPPAGRENHDHRPTGIGTQELPTPGTNCHRSPERDPIHPGLLHVIILPSPFTQNTITRQMNTIRRSRIPPHLHRNLHPLHPQKLHPEHQLSLPHPHLHPLMNRWKSPSRYQRPRPPSLRTK